MAGHAQAPAIDHGLCAFRNALADQAFDALLRHARDDRAHLGVKLVALAHFQGLHALAQLRHQGVGHVAHGDGHRDRHAALTGRAIGRADQRVHHLADVGVQHDHEVALGTAQGLHALAVADAFGVDVLGHRGQAHEADGLDHRMRQDGVHDRFVALQGVEDTIGQARVAGNIHIGTMAGKMKGVIPTARPRGPCMAQTSMPRGFGQWAHPTSTAECQ